MEETQRDDVTNASRGEGAGGDAPSTGETVAIERMSYGAAAVGHRADGKTVFVEGAAPGDVVEIATLEEKPTFARARIARLVEPSPLRVDGAGEPDAAQASAEASSAGPSRARAKKKPSSPRHLARANAKGFRGCASPCGGCPWAHLSYEAQLEAKRANVVEALVRTARLEAARASELVAPCLPSKRQWGYRNKIELGVGTDAAGRFALGFFREGSHDLAEVDACPLAHDFIAKAPKALRGALRFVQGAQDLGIFRVGVRGSVRTRDVEIALWTKPGPFPRGHVAKTLASTLKASSIVRVLADPGKARAIKGVETLAGNGYWEEHLGDLRFLASAPSFFQVNTAQAEKLVECVVVALGGSANEKVLSGLDGLLVADLYAGGGTFSVALARAGADVLAVESAGSSVRDLRRNASVNKVDVEVIGGDAARELPGLGQLDALVVDPPRAGLAKGVVEGIAAAVPERVAYVSCDPATWARDVAQFERCGYRLAHVQPVDLFPQTYHVEVVSLLARAKG